MIKTTSQKIDENREELRETMVSVYSKMNTNVVLGIGNAHFCGSPVSLIKRKPVTELVRYQNELGIWV